MAQPVYLSVSQITRYIRDLLDTDIRLQDCWVEGEVSNYQRSTTGHVYFTLKDETARLSCVMWRSQVALQTYTPRDGEAVVCHGRISVYEAQGRYQFYVDEVHPAGLGVLHLQFEALKQKLAAEGLFDEARKRPLPPYPRRIGIVTSPQAAALRDICHVLSRRYPLVDVILAPSLVQGEEAPAQIIAALEALNGLDVDVVIVARGGGSLEELWAFNDEAVARAIAASRVPVIAGVGHETDFTIADFVADVRAPTPSSAAEMAVPDGAELQRRIGHYRSRLVYSMLQRLEAERNALSRQRRALDRHAPSRVIPEHRQRVDSLTRAAQRALAHRLALERERVASRVARLQALDPRATLARGYAIVRHRDTDRVVTSVRQVSPGDRLAIQVQDGTFDSVVGRGKRRTAQGGDSQRAEQLGFDL
jgi:exodeoxyribonuclease VII large subunit